MLIGQGFFGHCLVVVAHPVNPMVARQTTDRRVASDFIIDRKIAKKSVCASRRKRFS